MTPENSARGFSAGKSLAGEAFGSSRGSAPLAATDAKAHGDANHRPQAVEKPATARPEERGAKRRGSSAGERPGPSDGDCVRRLLGGDDRAFTLLIHRYEARLRKLAFGFVRDYQLAEDIAQDTFLQAYRRIRSLQNPDSFRSWLFSIAINRSRDEVRRLARLSDGADLEAPLQAAAAGPSTERLLQSRELGRWLARLIARLPHKQRVPLVLKEVSGMTYAEIAELLDLPMGTVQIRIHRARLRLREQLQALGWRRDRTEGE